MVRVLRRAGAVLKLGVTSRTHEIGFVGELQRSSIRSGIVAVRIMAGSATHLSFPETLRAFQGFYHERGLTEPAILVKTLSGELAEGNAEMGKEEISCDRIV